MTGRQLTLLQSVKPSKSPATPNVPITWRLQGPRQSVLIGEFGHLSAPREHIQGTLALDLDGTLITPKSGRKWPKDIHDWCWLYGGPKGTLIKEKLLGRHQDGFSLCVISNQKYTHAHKSPDLHVATLKDKLSRIFGELCVPLTIYCSLGDDEFRKPRIGLIDLMALKGSKFLYVGDAAGRQKDHSACDYQWALNAKWDFMTPEMFFLNRQSDLPRNFDFDPRPLQHYDAPHISALLAKLIKEFTQSTLFVLVGPPGAGKSFLARTALGHCGWLNQDTLKDKTKLLKMLRQQLAEKRSVVVDRMNASVAQRRPFLEIAQEMNVPYVCVFLEISKALAQHGNIFRMLSKTTKESRDGTVPTLAYNMYYKDFQAPTDEEGFSKIISIKCGDYGFGPFESVADAQLFFQFLR